MSQPFRIEFEPAAWRQIMKLPLNVQDQIFNDVERLESDPRPPQAIKLEDKGNLYRLRSGSYRLVYTLENALLLVTVVRIQDRKDVYREKR